MRPYGVRVIEWPDVGDLASMASKGSDGFYPGPGGDYRGRKVASKAATRRYWKRRARRAGKLECRED
jgi:hypothetical protein